MTNPLPFSARKLTSTVTQKGDLLLSLDIEDFADVADDEVIVRIDAAPLNPSDIGLMLASVPAGALRRADAGGDVRLVGSVGADTLTRFSGRFGEALPVGLEGQGQVVHAGARASGLLGKTVAVQGYGTFAQYKKTPMSSCLVLPYDTPPETGAGAFVNPMTALSMVETMRREGHAALVQTAAASNLGQILVRLCNADGIDLVNIVRSVEQQRLLQDMGAKFVLNSQSETFEEDLTQALRETGATLAFDAVGGGDLASQILTAMERANNMGAQPYSRYGSAKPKQVYIYGGLDGRPIILRKDFGMAWSIGGWLLFNVQFEFGETVVDAMKERVVRELRTTFASHFSRSVSLEELLVPEVLDAAARRTTGAKFLVRP